MTVLHGKDSFLILVLSTKKRFSSFLKKVFVFRKFCFKVQVLKTIKISTDCHIKHINLSNRGLLLKPLVLFFRQTYALSVSFKMKRIQKAFSSVKIKANTDFAIKLAERSKHP